MALFKRSNQIRKSASITKTNANNFTYSSKRNEVSKKTSRQSIEELNKQRAKTKPKFVVHIGALIIVFAIFGSLIYFLTLNMNVKVKIVDNGENLTLRDQSIYKQVATDFASQSILNRSKLMFDSQGLTAKIKQEFPEVAGVDVGLPLLSRQIVLNLQLTKPVFILDSKQNSYLIGSNGVALLKTTDVSDLSKLNLLTVTDQSTLAIELGKPAIPKEQALFISTVLEQFEKQNMPIESIIIPTNLYDLHLKIQGLNYFLKLNILEDPKQQVGSFVALKNHLDAKGQAPAEYVDLRVGERVFYK